MLSPESSVAQSISTEPDAFVVDRSGQLVKAAELKSKSAQAPLEPDHKGGLWKR